MTKLVIQPTEKKTGRGSNVEAEKAEFQVIAQQSVPIKHTAKGDKRMQSMKKVVIEKCLQLVWNQIKYIGRSDVVQQLNLTM